MSNLIMGAAYGYKTKDLEPFVKSLRRVWDDDCLFVVSPLTEDDHKFYNKYNIITYELETKLERPSDIQCMRYGIYKTLIEDHFPNVEQILIIDTRDTIFQDDPFKKSSNTRLEFFAENTLFKNSPPNWDWMASLYGVNTAIAYNNNLVYCSGSTMGTRDGMLEYFDTMIAEIKRLNSLGRRLYGGEDQPVHNHVIFTSNFKDCTCHLNNEGPIATIHYQDQFIFNRKGQLLQADNTPTPVIHQWDRADACKPILEKTALEGLK